MAFLDDVAIIGKAAGVIHCSRQVRRMAETLHGRGETIGAVLQDFTRNFKSLKIA